MHVGQHGNTDLLAYAPERLESCIDAGAAKTRLRGSIGLVERRLEDERNAQRRRHVAQAPRHVDHQRLALDDAGTGDQEKRAIGPDIEGPELHAVARPGRCAARYSLAARMNPENSGWPSRGVEVNSG